MGMDLRQRAFRTLLPWFQVVRNTEKWLDYLVDYCIGVVRASVRVPHTSRRDDHTAARNQAPCQAPCQARHLLAHCSRAADCSCNSFGISPYRIPRLNIYPPDAPWHAVSSCIHPHASTQIVHAVTLSVSDIGVRRRKAAFLFDNPLTPLSLLL